MFVHMLNHHSYRVYVCIHSERLRKHFAVACRDPIEHHKQAQDSVNNRCLVYTLGALVLIHSTPHGKCTEILTASPRQTTREYKYLDIQQIGHTHIVSKD